VSTQQWSIC